MAAASPISLDQPVGGPSQTGQQSPSEGREVNGSQPTSPPQRSPAAGIQRSTDSKDYDSRGKRHHGWVGWNGLDRRALQLRLLQIGFEYHQTKRELELKMFYQTNDMQTAERTKNAVFL